MAHVTAWVTHGRRDRHYGTGGGDGARSPGGLETRPYGGCGPEGEGSAR